MNEKANGKTTFITVRHGDYDDNNNLSPIGEEQMRKVARQINEFNITDQPVTIICSTAPRAQQGGQIIAKELGIPIERIIFNECLWEDSYHHSELDEVKKLVGNNLHENQILLGISHLELVPVTASYVAEKFGHKSRFSESKYGAGYLINSEGSRPFPQ